MWSDINDNFSNGLLVKFVILAQLFIAIVTASAPAHEVGQNLLAFHEEIYMVAEY